VVILGDSRDPAPGWSHLYGELALYEQAAGLSVLQVDYRQPERLDERAFDLLGAVMALRSRGAERVLVVSRARTDGTTSAAHGASAVVPGFIRSVLSLSRTTGEVPRHMAEFVDRIGMVIETVSATATILTQAGARRRPARLVMQQRMLDMATNYHPSDRWVRGVQIKTGKSGEVVLCVGDEVSAERRAALIELLYGWSRAHLQHIAAGAKPASATEPIRHTGPEPAPTLLRDGDEARATFQATRAWLDERWSEVVESMCTRDPQRAAQLIGDAASTAGTSGTEQAMGVSVREARQAWRYLDAQAREEWMAAYSRLIRLVRATSGLGRPESWAPGGPDQTTSTGA
jgi:hypothetical protein